MTIKPGVMACLDDDALLRSVEPTTPLEAELMRRLSIYAEQETPESIESRLEREYEVRLEQSYFRGEFIEAVLKLCEQSGTKKELVNAIKITFENSQVEL